MPQTKLKVLDLFSGIGGFSLGLESTGFFETMAFVEKDEFCQKVLKKNFNNIPIEGDIRNVKGEKYRADVITGGFPCQPFSVAGKRKGTDDDRYLWDETIRVVRECKPKWFIGENVEGLVNIQKGMVLRQVQTDLEKEGFEVQCLIIPASGIGAFHQRKRIWIIGYNVSNSNARFSIGENQEIQTRGNTINNGSSSNVSNSKCNKHKHTSTRQGGTGQLWRFYSTKKEQTTHDLWSKTSGCNPSFGQETWWNSQSRICRIPHGLSERVDRFRKNRIKSLGNSIVPQIARELGLAIMEAENE